MSCGEFVELTSLAPDYEKMNRGCAPKTHHTSKDYKECSPYEKPVKKEQKSWTSNYWFAFILGFIFLAVIIALLLAAAKPTWVQNTDANTGQADGTVNAGKVILWATVVSIFIILIIWIVLALLWNN